MSTLTYVPGKHTRPNNLVPGEVVQFTEDLPIIDGVQHYKHENSSATAYVWLQSVGIARRIGVANTDEIMVTR